MLVDRVDSRSSHAVSMLRIADDFIHHSNSLVLQTEPATRRFRDCKSSQGEEPAYCTRAKRACGRAVTHWQHDLPAHTALAMD